MKAFEHIPGADRLIERFGSWPSFHDAEVLRVMLDRRGDHPPTGEMLVHAWRMTDQVDDRGYYVRNTHTLVRFAFEGIASIELSEFNHQNVLFDLEIAPDTTDSC